MQTCLDFSLQPLDESVTLVRTTDTTTTTTKKKKVKKNPFLPKVQCSK